MDGIAAPMKIVEALVLCGYGINCDYETADAFARAGARAQRVHLNDLIAAPDRLHAAHILAVPGGFSFGDDIASGKILANRLRFRLGADLKRFVADGKLVIGICNGFQVLVKLGLLPWFDQDFVQEVTLTHNDSARFEDRWVLLERPENAVSVWLRGVNTLELPVRHGEGKFLCRDRTVLGRLQRQGQIALRYALPGGGPAYGRFPANPNGSEDDIAAISDPSGRIFGLMPHPEAYLDRFNHPRWTRESLPEDGAGLSLFKNGVDFARNSLL